MKYSLSVFVMFFIICMSGFAFAEASKDVSNPNQFRIGVGGGVPYGGIGINAEYRFNTYVSLGAGFGYYRHEAPGVSGGVMFYPLKNDGKINPRFSAFFGRVSTYEWHRDSGASYRAIYGGAVGAGFDWRFYERFTFGVDAFYLMKNNPRGYKGGIGASAGLGIMF
jgi:hypothetical protein